MRILLIAVCMLVLNGCAATVAALTLGSMTYGTFRDERSFGNILDDTAIKTKILKLFIEEGIGPLFTRIQVNVKEGRVLLTGNVKRYEDALEAVRLCWLIIGVKEVINELEIGRKSLSIRATDILIANQIRIKFMTDSSIISSNYTVDVNQAKVYLIGIAKNKEELNKALDIAQSIKGVSKVINYTILTSDSRRQGVE